VYGKIAVYCHSCITVYLSDIRQLPTVVTENNFTNSLIQFRHLVHREDRGGPLPAPITLSTIRTGLYHCLLIRHSSIANCDVIKRVHKFFVCTHLVLALFTLDNFITLSTTRTGVGLYQNSHYQNQENKVCKMTTDQYR